MLAEQFWRSRGLAYMTSRSLMARYESSRAAQGALPDGPARAASDVHGRIIPGDPPHHEGDEESLDVWGFRDTAFTALPNGHVALTGSR